MKRIETENQNKLVIIEAIVGADLVSALFVIQGKYRVKKAKEKIEKSRKIRRINKPYRVWRIALRK